MDIQNKRLDDALGIIAKLCDLDVQHESNVIFISTLAERHKAQETTCRWSAGYIPEFMCKDIRRHQDE